MGKLLTSNEIDRKSFAKLIVFAVGGLLFFLLNRSYVSNSPLNPDGAELVMAAVRGGVLHPPGFPVQAWLDRIILACFNGNPARILSLFSLVSLSLSAIVMILIGSELSFAWVSCIFSVGTLCFHPVVRSLGLQPEKYSLTLLLFLVTVLASLRLLRKEVVPTRGQLLFLGAVFGTAMSQHIGLAICVPLIVAALIPNGPRAGRVFIVRLAIFFGSFSLVFLLWSASMLLLT